MTLIEMAIDSGEMSATGNLSRGCSAAAAFDCCAREDRQAARESLTQMKTCLKVASPIRKRVQSGLVMACTGAAHSLR